MKKTFSFIIAALIVLAILFQIPSSFTEKQKSNGIEKEFASLPGVKVPPLPPKE